MPALRDTNPYLRDARQRRQGFVRSVISSARVEGVRLEAEDMDTLAAYLMAKAHSDNEPMVFDWIKAAKIIKKRNAQEASAGLSGDWEYTGGDILRDGKPVPEEHTYVYLQSNWATPELEVGGEIIPCFKKKSDTPGWNASTYWPPEAMAILEGVA